MRASAIRWATRRTVAAARTAPPAEPDLMQPLVLYRRILRAHRVCLPPDLQELGDRYLRAEWKLHRTTTNPLHIVGFLRQWQTYLQHLLQDTWRSVQFDKAKMDRMSDDQIEQMYSLMKASQSDGADMPEDWKPEDRGK